MAEAHPEQQTLTATELAHLLAVDRRQAVIKVLADEDPIRVSALADRIAAQSTATRKDDYSSLRRSHLPKLADHGVIEFTDRQLEVTTGPEFGRAREALAALTEVSDA